jgi:ferredoxin
MSEVRERQLGDVTLRIHRDRCIGTGACSKVVPETLAFDDQQIIDFLDEPPATVERERLYEACEVCPVEALELVDADGRVVAP